MDTVQDILESFFSSWLGLLYYVLTLAAILAYWARLHSKPHTLSEVVVAMSLLVSILAGMAVDHRGIAFVSTLVAMVVLRFRSPSFSESIVVMSLLLLVLTSVGIAIMHDGESAWVITLVVLAIIASAIRMVKFIVQVRYRKP